MKKYLIVGIYAEDNSQRTTERVEAINANEAEAAFKRKRPDVIVAGVIRQSGRPDSIEDGGLKSIAVVRNTPRFHWIRKAIVRTHQAMTGAHPRWLPRYDGLTWTRR